jgi:hypothetical protein
MKWYDGSQNLRWSLLVQDRGIIQASNKQATCMWPILVWMAYFLHESLPKYTASYLWTRLFLLVRVLSLLEMNCQSGVQISASLGRGGWSGRLVESRARHLHKLGRLSRHWRLISWCYDLWHCIACRWRQYVPPKRWQPHISLYGVMIQQATI